jgi:hypothetical protein
MSYTVATPGGKSRPATVTAASGLLFVCAAVEVASVVLSVIRIGPVLSVLNDEFANSSAADTVRATFTVGIIAGVVIAAVFAIGTVVLGLLLRKGKNPARIVTWVLGGIGVLCYACGLGGSALGSSLNGMGATSNPDAEAIQKRLTEAVPGWQTALGTAASVVLLLALLAVIILLALPASNEFFRKEQEVWVPPSWPGDGGAGYPQPLPPAPSGPFGQPGPPP